MGFGNATQGTELVDLRVFNSKGSHRNIFYENSRAFVVFDYSKVRNLTFKKQNNLRYVVKKVD